jgi:hypothetical protein
MDAIAFTSNDPLDHVCRALDVVRKMGFRLSSVSVVPGTAQTFCVHIAFEAGEGLSVLTLVERVALCVGVEGLSYRSEAAAA